MDIFQILYFFMVEGITFATGLSGRDTIGKGLTGCGGVVPIWDSFNRLASAGTGPCSL